MNPKKLKDLRRSIDAIDSGIIELINKRGVLSTKIGSIKKDRGESINSPDRESHVYSSVVSRNPGPVQAESLKAVYREIMSACLSLEKTLKVGYLGPECTFTHQAAMKKFGSSVDYVPCDSISDVFGEVAKGNTDYGVVPIENSIEGAVNHTLDMFMDSPLLICSEIMFPIRHSIQSTKGKLSVIKKIYSKPEVFGQCRRWIEKNLPSARLLEASSTARAAEIAADSPDSACIASSLAAERYGLKIVAASIEDSARNVTRFLVIGDRMSKISGRDKTAIMFSVKDRPGVLHDMLGAFKKQGINLTKIESRPSKQRLWKYYFFVDMDGHYESPHIKNALKELEKKCHFVKLLGSFPKAS
ncbi:MAG: prephenate dehydratase [Candidatus Omnitrophica bacterium]|nr:prephenate dehydratase [Candidatus Omnitrophota bacterium]